MDVKARADLVRQIRLDMKQKRQPTRRMPDANWYDSPSANPRQGEGRDTYLQRRARQTGGDGALYDASARWDRQRAAQSPLRRAVTRRAPRNEPYVGYQGDWRGHFTPQVTMSAAKRRRLNAR